MKCHIIGILQIFRVIEYIAYNGFALAIWRHQNSVLQFCFCKLITNKYTIINFLFLLLFSFSIQSGNNDKKYKSSLFMLKIGILRLPKLKLISDMQPIFLTSPRYICQCNFAGRHCYIYSNKILSIRKKGFLLNLSNPCIIILLMQIINLGRIVFQFFESLGLNLRLIFINL